MEEWGSIHVFCITRGLVFVVYVVHILVVLVGQALMLLVLFLFYNAGLRNRDIVTHVFVNTIIPLPVILQRQAVTSIRAF